MDKLVRAGILDIPIRTDDVERLMGRDRLQVTVASFPVAVCRILGKVVGSKHHEG